MTDTAIDDLARQVIETYAARGLTLGTAESCTGGLIAGALTGISGSSAVVDRGFVTYSNDAKMDLLDVDDGILRDHGAVSEATARAMAWGVLTHAPVDCAVAVTGVAGPTGGTKDKPVGLVHFGAARHGRDIVHERHVFDGDRAAVRRATVQRALALLLALAD
ncbi:CinA family protein [Thalassospiraceae bacterium LMO-SO8]|nr:CinA family protein [Alphaproteobacteria bacterium LMO-S08]WND75702.1 CinA family protein [Thalassospiraceae bacterium LMO-SO8]